MRQKTQPSSLVFTDKQLSDLYTYLQGQFSSPDLVGAQTNAMGQQLAAQFQWGGAYYGYDVNEQQKIITVCNTFIQAKDSAAQSFIPFTFNTLRPPVDSGVPPVEIHHHHYRYSNWFSDFLFWSLIFSPNHARDCNHLLALICIAVFLVTLYLSVGYLFNTLAGGVERLWYNEGKLQAGISMLGAIVGGISAAMLLLAAMNPIAVVLSLSIIAAAVTACITNFLQDKFMVSTHPNAIDAHDPHRYGLTDREVENLMNKHLDPTKVKLAIVALRVEIGQCPSITDRLFRAKAQDKQAMIQTIRMLRHGDLAAVSVGSLRFDLRQDQAIQPANQTPYGAQPAEGVPLGSKLAPCQA